MRILVCDTDQKRNEDYDLQEIFTKIGISPEIVEALPEEAMRKIVIGEKFNLLIASYDFTRDDSYEVIEVVKKCQSLSIPSVFLDYPADRGISRYVTDNTSAVCVYKHEASIILSDIIKALKL